MISISPFTIIHRKQETIYTNFYYTNKTIYNYTTYHKNNLQHYPLTKFSKQYIHMYMCYILKYVSLVFASARWTVCPRG